jgi:hypothetical protein
VLVQDGVFDSGLAAILDVLDFANAMADQVPEAPSWRATMVGLQPEVRTGAGQLVTTQPAAQVERADLLIVPARGARRPAEVLDYVVGDQSLPVRTP